MDLAISTRIPGSGLLFNVPSNGPWLLDQIWGIKIPSLRSLAMRQKITA